MQNNLMEFCSALNGMEPCMFYAKKGNTEISFPFKPTLEKRLTDSALRIVGEGDSSILIKEPGDAKITKETDEGYCSYVIEEGDIEMRFDFYDKLCG